MVTPSQGKSLSAPSETPGIDCSGSSATLRANWRRANSTVTLLASNTTVLIKNSAVGNCTGSQSCTTWFVVGSSVGSPWRTT